MHDGSTFLLFDENLSAVSIICGVPDIANHDLIETFQLSKSIALLRRLLDNSRPSRPLNGTSCVYVEPDGVLGTLSRLKFVIPDSKCIYACF